MESDFFVVIFSIIVLSNNKQKGFLHILKPQVSPYLCESQVRLYVCRINLRKRRRGGEGCLVQQEAALPPAPCGQWESGPGRAAAPECVCGCSAPHCLVMCQPTAPKAMPDAGRAFLWPVFHRGCLQVLVWGAEKIRDQVFPHAICISLENSGFMQVFVCKLTFLVSSKTD